MSSLYRFGISLDKKLIGAFDTYVEREHYASRSEAIRDLIREKLVLKRADENGSVAGALVMSYDHHRSDLSERLMHIQHDYHECIISTQHVHLDQYNCLEIIAVRGKARLIEELASHLKALVGVTHLGISFSAYGVEDTDGDSGGAREHSRAREHNHAHAHDADHDHGHNHSHR